MGNKIKIRIFCVGVCLLFGSLFLTSCKKTENLGENLNPNNIAGFSRDSTIDNEYWGIVPEIKKEQTAIANRLNINRAIQTAHENGIYKIKLAKATYWFDATSDKKTPSIGLLSNMQFNLNGATLRVMPNNLTHHYFIYIESAENVKIFNGTITGDRYEHGYVPATYPTHEWCHGLRVGSNSSNYCKNIEIYDLVVQEFTGDGINVSWSKNVTIRNTEVSNARRNGITIGSNTDETYIYDNYIHDTHGVSPACGIDLEKAAGDGPKNIVIRNNRIWDVVDEDGEHGQAMAISGGSYQVIVRDNDIRGVIGFAYAEKILIENNHIWGHVGPPFTNPYWLNLIQYGPRNLWKPVNDVIIRNNTFDCAKIYFNCSGPAFQNIAVVGNQFNNGRVYTGNANTLLMDNTFNNEGIYDADGNRVLGININAISFHADADAGEMVTVYNVGNTITGPRTGVSYSGIEEGYLNVITDRAAAASAYNNLLKDFAWADVK
jgi:hypothetical protein